MLNVLKKLSIVLLALMLVFSFAACGKDDNTDNSSSPSNTGPVQDYDDEWGENITDDPAQSEATESLWNDGFSGGSAEIVGGNDESSSDADSSSQNSSSNTSSVESETTSSNDDNDSDYTPEIGKDYNGIF